MENSILEAVQKAITVMMKLFVAFVIIAAASTYADQYTDRYDDIDVNEITSNKRLLNTYFKCVLDKGRCTPEGKFLKEHIKDALQTGCMKCTDTQKQKARTVIQYIHEHEGQTFETIIKKYDPEDQYREVYEAFLKNSD